MNYREQLKESLRSLNLTTITSILDESIEKAEKNGWPYEKWLNGLCDQECAHREERKIKRFLKQAKIPENYRLDNLNQKVLPEKIRRKLPALLEGGFVKKHENVLAFGLPGRGKSHVVGAILKELVLKNHQRVLFIPTFKLVEGLLQAKKELRLEEALKKLDKFEVIALDDIGYVQQNREEMEVLFTFLAERYERRSIMITSNLVFSQWNKIFKDPMTTMAAVDRIVHHSVILEFSGESYRVAAAKDKGGS